jgi:hypothetical protein
VLGEDRRELLRRFEGDLLNDLPSDLGLGGGGLLGGDLAHPGGPARQVVLDALHRNDRIAGGAHRTPGDRLRQFARVGAVVPQHGVPATGHLLERAGVVGHEKSP